MVEKVATNIVASQPPNSYRLQRRPLVSKVVDRRNEDKQEMKTSLEMKTALKKKVAQDYKTPVWLKKPKLS